MSHLVCVRVVLIGCWLRSAILVFCGIDTAAAGCTCVLHQILKHLECGW